MIPTPVISTQVMRMDILEGTTDSFMSLGRDHLSTLCSGSPCLRSVPSALFLPRPVPAAPAKRMPSEWLPPSGPHSIAPRVGGCLCWAESLPQKLTWDLGEEESSPRLVRPPKGRQELRG
ncbi:hypothetical protein D623_10030020 [Myotis brandtii]|uniref:Uncharacterized protein n=1 Tax=Myotis brandtii TaxID=109478 RepID=S7P7X7_MYOBR|nr:hypothetical protein D623_10030020 [Myotis brandtii]